MIPVVRREVDKGLCANLASVRVDKACDLIVKDAGCELSVVRKVTKANTRNWFETKSFD